MNKSTTAPPGRQRFKRFLAALPASQIDESTRTIQFPFSSEQPVERWFGAEVLSHAPGAADLSRLNDSAPFLFNHNSDDVIGVVESAEIGSDRRGYCTVRFAKTPRGDEIMGMVTDGILRNVSFAYQVENYMPSPDSDGDGDAYTAMNWCPYEVSLAPVPADQSVGIGRAQPKLIKGKKMSNIELEESENQTRSQRRNSRAGAEAERERIMEITAMGKRFNQERLANQFIESGATVQDFQSETLAQMARTPQRAIAGSADLDLSSGEIRSFSMVRAIQAIVKNDWSDAGFERECSRTVARKLGKETQGFFIPADVLTRGQWGSRAPYQVGTPTQGGNLVQTQLLASNFIDALRNTAQVIQAGATILPGLVGKVDVPRRSTTTNSYWVAESGAVTEAEATFDKVSLSPKTVGALSKMSRLALMQTTPAIEQITRDDLLQQLGLAIDLAAMSGTGSGGQPLGIVNTAGIGSVVGGVNGANVTFDNLIALETALSNSNAPWATRGYMMNSKTVGTLKTLKSSTGAYLWTSNSNGQRSGTPPDFNGYPVGVTNQVRSNLTKGSSSGICSEIVFGAWGELLIGEWGVLEILVNPYDSTGFTSGDVLIRALQTLDIQVRHAASFAVQSDALTP